MVYVTDKPCHCLPILEQAIPRISPTDGISCCSKLPQEKIKGGTVKTQVKTGLNLLHPARFQSETPCGMLAKEPTVLTTLWYIQKAAY